MDILLVSVSIAFSDPTIIIAFTWKRSIIFMSHLLFRCIDYIQKLVAPANEKQAGNGGSNTDLERGNG